MAFDSSLPADTTTIRNLSTVIPANWQAIETADSSFAPDAINFAQQGSHRPLIASIYQLYSKASGGTELFGINSNGDINQFTKGTPTLATTGSVFLVGGIILNWGQFTFTGTSGNDTFDQAYPNSGLFACASPLNTAAAGANWRVSTWTTTTVTIATSSSVTNASFTYLAIGY